MSRRASTEVSVVLPKCMSFRVLLEASRLTIEQLCPVNSHRPQPQATRRGELERANRWRGGRALADHVDMTACRAAECVLPLLLKVNEVEKHGVEGTGT